MTRRGPEALGMSAVVVRPNSQRESIFEVVLLVGVTGGSEEGAELTSMVGTTY